MGSSPTGPTTITLDEVRRPLRTLLSGRWLALHAVVLVLGVAMVLLGRWQLDVSDRKHFALQNFFYAFQWWTFTAFLLFFWLRVMRDHVRPPAPTEAKGELVVARPGDAAPAPGAAVMVAEPTKGATAEAPTLYRGYVMPQLSQHPDRTGDTDVARPVQRPPLAARAGRRRPGRRPPPTAPRPLVDAPTLAARARAAADRELGSADRPALPTPEAPDVP